MSFDEFKNEKENLISYYLINMKILSIDKHIIEK